MKFIVSNKGTNNDIIRHSETGCISKGDNHMHFYIQSTCIAMHCMIIMQRRGMIWSIHWKYIVLEIDAHDRIKGENKQRCTVRLR